MYREHLQNNVKALESLFFTAFFFSFSLMALGKGTRTKSRVSKLLSL